MASKTIKSKKAKKEKRAIITGVSSAALRERAILNALYNKNNSRLMGNSILDLLETHLISVAL